LKEKIRACNALNCKSGWVGAGEGEGGKAGRSIDFNQLHTTTKSGATVIAFRRAHGSD